MPPLLNLSSTAEFSLLNSCLIFIHSFLHPKDYLLSASYFLGPSLGFNGTLSDYRQKLEKVGRICGGENK